uniref:PRA1 family protein n=1 Tax=Populus davidiana TaxID=266767 RepID=A0A6M2F893_9ROSI
MAGHGTIDQRLSTMSTPTTPADPEDSTGKNRDDFERPEFRVVCPFSIPSSPEAASLRIIRNLGHFASYCTHFVWIVLFIALIPQREVISLIPLFNMIYVASLYLLSSYALPPNFYMLDKITDKSLGLGLIAVKTMIE